MHAQKNVDRYVRSCVIDTQILHSASTHQKRPMASPAPFWIEERNKPELISPNAVICAPSFAPRSRANAYPAYPNKLVLRSIQQWYPSAIPPSCMRKPKDSAPKGSATHILPPVGAFSWSVYKGTVPSKSAEKKKSADQSVFHKSL